jgi:hypothetical protein
MAEIDWRDTPSSGDTIANTGTDSFEEMANLIQAWETLYGDGTVLQLPASANLQVNGANAKRSIILTVGGGHPSTTSGAATSNTKRIRLLTSNHYM